jgi:hypothetical protein
MVGDLGKAHSGKTSWAITYWLYKFGRNPDSPDFDVNHGIDYDDYFQAERRLDADDYNYLLDELDRGHYVAVSFGFGDDGGSYEDPDEHANCLTLVGGDYYRDEYGGRTPDAVWHDTVRDKGDGPDPAAGDDVYENDFSDYCYWSTWNLQEPEGCHNLVEWRAKRYISLRPGLDKPIHAMEQYDVARFLQPTGSCGNMEPAFQEAGELKDVYADPFWHVACANPVVQIGNAYNPDIPKDIWLLVSYSCGVPTSDLDYIKLGYSDGAGGETTPVAADTVTLSPSNGQALFHWHLDYQPEWERIHFPRAAYKYLNYGVDGWNVATYCVPEPFSMAFMASAFVGVVACRVYKRRSKSSK